MNERPLVSVIVVVRDARHHLLRLLGSLRRQSYEARRTELILVDGGSKDGTLEAIHEASGEWARIVCLDNPTGTLAPGWNAAIRASRGEVLIRLDAHSKVAPEFVEQLVTHIEKGEAIVGGRIEARPGCSSATAKLIAGIEGERLGAAPASFRRAGEPRHVDTVAYAAYRREVFETVGLFNEHLTRNQDNEFHARCRAAGYRFLLDPAVVAAYTPRADMRAYLLQKALNGFWISRAAAIHPNSCHLRHYAPLLFLAMLAAVFVALPAAGLFVLISQLFALFWLATPSSAPEGERWLQAGLTQLSHLAYGSGTIAGFLTLPTFLARIGSAGLAPPALSSHER